MSTTNSAGWDAGTSMHPAIGDEPEHAPHASDDAARLVELVLRARDDRRSRDWVLMNLSLSEAIEHAEAMEARAKAQEGAAS